MKAILELARDLPDFIRYRHSLHKPGIASIDGCLQSQKVHLLCALSEENPYKLILSGGEQRARALYEDLRFYDANALYYPAKDLLFFSADVHGNLLIRQRMRVVKALIEGDGATVVCPIDACLDYLKSLSTIKEELLTIERGDTLDLSDLRKRLVALGYEATENVDLPGEFAIRGGIVDIYCPTEDDPWRLELWGDEVDSLRSFDANSQRSLEELTRIQIYPATEVFGEENSALFLDYFPKDTLVFLDEPDHLLESALSVSQEYLSSVQHRREKGECLLSEDWITTPQALLERFSLLPCMALSTLPPSKENWTLTDTFTLKARSIGGYRGSFERLLEDLRNYKKQGYRILLVSGSTTRAQRLAKDLSERELNAFFTQEEDRSPSPGEIQVVYGHSHHGFVYPEIKFALLTEGDIFGKEQMRRKLRKRPSGETIQSFSDLNVGDYVIHQRHGIGRYLGIEKIEVDGILKDYIKVEYASGSSLFVSASALDTLQKHSSGKAEHPPKLNSLGGKEWRKVRDKVQKEVKSIAADLVALYASRQDSQGFACGPDTVWQKEFEELFPYEETLDQLNAIEDTKRDMESTKIMDRLICGDVGYGKTEIALRAAFKEVMEGRQVVYLVPTTILAAQHYKTFCERMKEFPVRVDLLSRFRTPKEQKETLEGLKKGTVDVLIGTHRVLSKDVVYKNLGLLIIDEEQRFGVRHKEKIKQMKKEVDVLTLTATPIPRTLHMSLIGIRDMSLLEEPPMDRVPIQTYVVEYDEETVREAIGRELRRGGQVFYVYNRVQTIAEMCEKVQSLVPQAKVGYAHGQMAEKELEEIMISFINGELDVLVSTTIIETGLDISNVNTMIIHDSDRFGLSQLYQLRGRIGRSNRTAYAFLMYKRDKVLQETAEKRLSAIREFTDLGSGFKIAMRDLEIRGAGDLLGASQHGHMDAVGYDLYVKMLGEAVKEAKGITSVGSFDTSIDLNVDAYIPDTYIRNEYHKLNLYKKIALIEEEQEYDEMLDEFTDRFGTPPKPVLNLLSIALIKALAHKAYVTDVKQNDAYVVLKLYPEARLDVSRFPALLQAYPRRLRFDSQKEPHFTFVPGNGNGNGPLPPLLELVKKLGDLVLE